jgi:hypothetical protein
MKDFSAWILTFNRPYALNRIITTLGRQGLRTNVMSNHSLVQYTEESASYVDQTVINSLNTNESNLWNARSWNSVMLKQFEKSPNLMCIQDDTMVVPHFVGWLRSMVEQYDFVWGPAGDQFFYVTLDVIRKSGWWDERFSSPYCGDADFLKRVYHSGYDRSRMSIQDTHDWGFQWNPQQVTHMIGTDIQTKAIDPNYENVHWHMERIKTQEKNRVLLGAQAFFIKKWGHLLNNNSPVVSTYTPQLEEMDWYPWATTKYGITAYDARYEKDIQLMDERTRA